MSELIVEAEVKYELSQAQFFALPEKLDAFGFQRQEKLAHEDHYVFYQKNPIGGYDFERYRKITGVNGGSFLWNRKARAKDSKGKGVRVEDGEQVTAQEFEQALVSAVQDHPVVHKKRQDFGGKIEHFTATVSLDEALFNGIKKYFLEVEILTDLEQGNFARRLCKDFAKDVLGITSKSAPGYLRQYLAARAP